jgi:putative membrane protein
MRNNNGTNGTKTMRRALAVAACAAALAACAKKDNAGTDTLATSAAPAMGTDTAMSNMGGSTSTAATNANNAAGAATVAVTSDAEILSAIGMANTTEIGEGKLAESKATSADVKSFARDMVKDHTSMQSDADKLAKSAKITPAAPAAATQMKAEATAMMDSLKAAKGPTFDQQYIAGEVADHQKTLANLQSFQGKAQNADLKNMIQQAIPKVQQHLDRAKELQTKLGTKA